MKLMIKYDADAEKTRFIDIMVGQYFVRHRDTAPPDMEKLYLKCSSDCAVLFTSGEPVQIMARATDEKFVVVSGGITEVVFTVRR